MSLAPEKKQLSQSSLYDPIGNPPNSLCTQLSTAAPLSSAVVVKQLISFTFLPLHSSSSMSLHPPECSSFSPPATVILLILLCFEGLLFLIFTSVMFGTQVHSICTDETVSYPLIVQQSSSFPLTSPRPSALLPAAATLLPF